HDAAIVGHRMEVEILRHHDHVAIALGNEVRRLPHRHTAEPGQRADQRHRVGRHQRDLADRAGHAHAKTAAGRDAEFDLIEQPKLHLGVGKNHFDVSARDVFKELHVNKVAFDGTGQQAAGALDDLFRVLALETLFAHDLVYAQLERLQLEQQE